MDEPVHALATKRGVRLHVPAPDHRNTPAWQAALTALRSADAWGSTDTTDTPEIWAEIFDEATA